MVGENLRARTKAFALRVFEYVGGLPHNVVAKTVGNQLARSGTSVGANYHSACRARSRADFISKIQIAEEESDECEYWLDLARSVNLGDRELLDWLVREASELTAILAQCAITAKRRRAADGGRGRR